MNSAGWNHKALANMPYLPSLKETRRHPSYWEPQVVALCRFGFADGQWVAKSKRSCTFAFAGAVPQMDARTSEKTYLRLKTIKVWWLCAAKMDHSIKVKIVCRRWVSSNVVYTSLLCIRLDFFYIKPYQLSVSSFNKTLHSPAAKVHPKAARASGGQFPAAERSRGQLRGLLGKVFGRWFGTLGTHRRWAGV